MSCIVGIVENDEIWVGADGRASTEDGDIRPMKDKKLFRNGKYLFGNIGSVRIGQVLTPVHFKPPQNVLKLPDAIRKKCLDMGCIAYNEHQVQVLSSNLLVVAEGKMYTVLIDFQMTEVEYYTSLGAGCFYAYGSLYTTHKQNYHPEDRVRIALEAACEFNGACGPPFDIFKV